MALAGSAELPEGFEFFFPYLKGHIRSRGMDYLHGRGVTNAQVRQHRVGFAAVGRYAYRVIFPIYDSKRLMTFIGRDFSGQQDPKFLNRRGAKPLWNSEKLGRFPGCTVVLYEGIFKALAGERAIPDELDDRPVAVANAVVHAATLGSHITDLQLSQLSPRVISEIILFPDPDRAGLDGFLKVGRALVSRHYKRLSVAWPLPQQEADDMDPAELAECINNRQPFNIASWAMASCVTLEESW